MTGEERVLANLGQELWFCQNVSFVSICGADSLAKGSGSSWFSQCSFSDQFSTDRIWRGHTHSDPNLHVFDQILRVSTDMPTPHTPSGAAAPHRHSDRNRMERLRSQPLRFGAAWPSSGFFKTSDKLILMGAEISKPDKTKRSNS